MRALEHNGVVIRRIDADVRDPDIAAGIDVNAVAIRIDRDVVDREVIDAGCQNAEVSAVQNGKIPQRDVMREFEGDCFIGATVVTGKSAAADQTRSDDRDVLQILAPDEAS